MAVWVIGLVVERWGLKVMNLVIWTDLLALNLALQDQSEPALALQQQHRLNLLKLDLPFAPQ